MFGKRSSRVRPQPSSQVAPGTEDEPPQSHDSRVTIGKAPPELVMGRGGGPPRPMPGQSLFSHAGVTGIRPPPLMPRPSLLLNHDEVHFLQWLFRQFQQRNHSAVGFLQSQFRQF
ncbi:unnamed protein product, partial [Amoebophrya sp. A25]|eukprot:GSA25T00018418001.1